MGNLSALAEGADRLVASEALAMGIPLLVPMPMPPELYVGDFSSAAFFMVGASISGGSSLLIENVGVNPTRTGAPELLVEDTLDGLWDLGRAGRARLAGQAVAVTGSSGQTTLKGYLAGALECPAAAGSLNNFWGVPLTLARERAK